MKLGTDLIYIPEFKIRLENMSSLDKVFTETELNQSSRPESLAGVFAAKEAFMKALGKKIDWLDVWVEKKESGQPVLFSTLLKSNEAVKLSISHSGDYATAIVIINNQ